MVETQLCKLRGTKDKNFHLSFHQWPRDKSHDVDGYNSHWLAGLTVYVAVVAVCCFVTGKKKNSTRYRRSSTILTTTTSWPSATAAAESCWWWWWQWWRLLLLIVVEVAMGIYMWLLLLLSVSNFTSRVRTWYQVNVFCADAQCLATKAISQGYCTIIGLTECVRFKNNPTLH